MQSQLEAKVEFLEAQARRLKKTLGEPRGTPGYHKLHCTELSSSLGFFGHEMCSQRNCFEKVLIPVPCNTAYSYSWIFLFCVCDIPVPCNTGRVILDIPVLANALPLGRKGLANYLMLHAVSPSKFSMTCGETSNRGYS